MLYTIRISFIAICLIFSLGVMAQFPETIITETGEEVPPNQQNIPEVPNEGLFVDDVVERTLIFESKVLPYPSLREADVPWSKKVWRKIDTRQKINQAWNYPPLPMAQILLDGIQEGSITAFNADDFQTVVSYDDVMSTLNLVDTIPVFDLETQTEKYEVVKNDFDPSSIKTYRIKEIWFFDEQSSRMGVRTLGISPVRDITNPDTGEFLRSEPMFWIYFPQARNHLARIQSFNGFNDSAPMTWADVIDSRRFASFIYKITNVNDDRLDLVYKQNPIEMLYESDRISEELFNLEQDLWSY